MRIKIQRYLGIKEAYEGPDYRIVKQEQKDGYKSVLICYQGSEGDEVPAYLLLPDSLATKSGFYPAIVIHHQHNGERHLGKSEVCGLLGDPWQAFGPTLARRGFIVLAPDSICFEDRRANQKGTVADDYGDFLQHYNQMCYRILQGSSLMKKVIDDANLGFALLFNHPRVDKKRIGLLGHSYGGNTVIFQMALNEGFAFGCSSGAVCTYRQKMQAGTGIEMAEVIPAFINNFDIDDLLECIAPRNFLVLSATEDKYSMDADAIVQRVKAKYIKQGVGNKLIHKRFNGGHALNEERFNYVIEWLADWL